MKLTSMAIFLTIVLTIYTLVNWYIFSRTSPIFVGSSVKTFSLRLILWIIILAYPVARILERFIGSGFTTFFVKAGSFWLGAMLYLVLLFLLIDIARGINHLIPFASFLNFKSNPESRLMVIKIVYIIMSIVLIAGYINAHIPRINHFTLNFGKSLGKYEKIRLVAVSDIHLGTLISKNRLNYLVDKINEQNPDIVLFAGDVFDEDIAPVVNNGLGKYFEQIKSPLGVFAITGNHEFFGGVEQKVNYLKAHGVKVLRDSTVLIDDSFFLVGRDDRQTNYSTGKKRLEITDLLYKVDKSKPIILLDHQPFNLNITADNGVDLQISGHTHHGQLWPFNYITNAIYELSSGYKKIGNTNFIVSNGYGTWGPPIRLGNRPEILVVDILNK